jgi:hypothetical protein
MALAPSHSTASHRRSAKTITGSPRRQTNVGFNRAICPVVVGRHWIHARTVAGVRGLRSECGSPGRDEQDRSLRSRNRRSNRSTTGPMGRSASEMGGRSREFSPSRGVSVSSTLMSGIRGDGPRLEPILDDSNSPSQWFTSDRPRPTGANRTWAAIGAGTAGRTRAGRPATHDPRAIAVPSHDASGAPRGHRTRRVHTDRRRPAV